MKRNLGDARHQEASFCLIRVAMAQRQRRDVVDSDHLIVPGAEPENWNTGQDHEIPKDSIFHLVFRAYIINQ
jgi:hypothetical protein